jgi:hypothetical protein
MRIPAALIFRQLSPHQPTFLVAVAPFHQRFGFTFFIRPRLCGFSLRSQMNPIGLLCALDLPGSVVCTPIME